MNLVRKFINLDDGKLFAQIIAISIILLLAMFTQLQRIEFGLKLFVMLGVIWISVQIMQRVRDIDGSYM
jgi:hypothetical protein